MICVNVTLYVSRVVGMLRGDNANDNLNGTSPSNQNSNGT